MTIEINDEVLAAIQVGVASMMPDKDAILDAIKQGVMDALWPPNNPLNYCQAVEYGTEQAFSKFMPTEDQILEAIAGRLSD